MKYHHLHDKNEHLEELIQLAREELHERKEEYEKKSHLLVEKHIHEVDHMRHSLEEHIQKYEASRITEFEAKHRLKELEEG